MTRPNTRSITLTLALALVIALAGAAGCTPDEESEAVDLTGQKLEIDFATLATEDALPLWVADSEGLFEEADLDVQISVFQAAAERDTALTAGGVDCMMGDLIATALLENGGFPVSATTIMLGATAEEGRFGIVTTPGSEVTTLEGLAGVPVGTSLGTIQELVVDSLFEQAGLDAADVAKEAVPKVPVRFELLMEGQLEAAALPEPLLTFAEFQGGTIVADDTEGDNITQTVLIASDEWLETDEGAEAMARLLAVWDEAVAIINEDPNAWRDILVVRARLPEPLIDTYPVNTYPMAQPPTEEMVTSVVDWMTGPAALLEDAVPYEDLVWEPEA